MDRPYIERERQFLDRAVERSPNDYKQNIQNESRVITPLEAGRPTSVDRVLTFQMMSPADPVSALSQLGHNASSIEDSSVIMRHEVYQLKKQLADSQSSYNFMKKEKMRVEHEKNLLDIQLKQFQSSKYSESDEAWKRVKELEGMLAKEQVEVKELQKDLQGRDQKYKDKLIAINSELEHLGKKKSKSKEKVYQLGMQIKVSVQNMAQIARSSNKEFEGFVIEIERKTDLLENLIV